MDCNHQQLWSKQGWLVSSFFELGLITIQANLSELE